MAFTELWQTPSPSSSFLEGVYFRVLPARMCLLSFDHEGTDSLIEACELRFHDVVAFKCTYMPALTVEMIQSAYDRLVELGATPWLDEVNSLYSHTRPASLLKHLRICFDDGPCYEFICTEFEARHDRKLEGNQQSAT